MQDVNLRGMIGRLAACSAALAIAGLSTSAMAQTGGSGGMSAKQWTGAGSNGHWYALVQNGKAWDIARKYASDNGAHLVTINSAEEQALIVANILSRVSPESKVWIGARAPRMFNCWQKHVDFFSHEYPRSLYVGAQCDSNKGLAI